MTSSRASNEEAQEQLVEEIKSNSKGTHRILLDLTPGSGWVARRMAKMNPTVLVPVAPDMNSVISLQAVEKYFHGVVDSDGRPLQPYYVMNQFDASLPLHLDVREVLRRQLGRPAAAVCDSARAGGERGAGRRNDGGGLCAGDAGGRGLSECGRVAAHHCGAGDCGLP